GLRVCEKCPDVVKSRASSAAHILDVCSGGVAASGVEAHVFLMSKEDKLIESAKKSLIKAVDYDKKEKLMMLCAITWMESTSWTKAFKASIEANSVGHGYDKIFGRCLDDKLTAVSVQDAYVCAHHQILNFVRFCELVVGNAPNIRCITLRTGMEARNNQVAFDELTQSLEKVNVVLKVEFSPSIHDREIRFNNGWIR
ncbi:hypothetical protein OSTOST_05636, partial [Ostertagia ostertagi]